MKLSNLTKKFLVLLISSFYFLTSSFMPFAIANAQEESSTWYNQGFTDWYAKVYGQDSPPSEIFGERYTAAQVEWILYSLFAFILHNAIDDKDIVTSCLGGDAVACGKAITKFVEKVETIINNANSNPSGQINNNLPIAQQILSGNRKLSGIGYLKEKLGNLHVIPSVNAQGFGFDAFDPIQGIWSASRNVAYSLAVLAIIILAFMIMFRVKISPQVVITAQSAIPKVISALILATFSYAIAGFLVDLMYVIIGLISLVLSQYTSGGSSTTIFRTMTDGVMYTGFLGNISLYAIAFFASLFVTLFASGTTFSSMLTGGALPIILILIIIITAIMMIFITFKIFWLLLKTLAQIYLSVMIAPLQIILGSVSSNIGFGAWMRNLISHLAVYPIVGALFQVAYLFIIYSLGLSVGNMFNISLINRLSSAIFGKEIPIPDASWSPPLTIGEDYSPLIFLGISFVIITLIPKTAEIIQGFITGKPFAYGSAIGEASGPAKGLARFGLGYYGGRESELGQEDYRLDDVEGSRDRAKARIKRGELLKSASNLIK